MKKQRTRRAWRKFVAMEHDHITPEMTVLAVIERYRETEATFRKYDEQAGVCLCCHALFETLKDFSQKYGIDLERLIAELEGKTIGISIHP